MQTFVGKVMSLFFNMLSMFVIAFLFRIRSGHFVSLLQQSLASATSFVLECWGWGS